MKKLILIPVLLIYIITHAQSNITKADLVVYSETGNVMLNYSKIENGIEIQNHQACVMHGDSIVAYCDSGKWVIIDTTEALNQFKLSLEEISKENLYNYKLIDALRSVLYAIPISNKTANSKKYKLAIKQYKTLIKL